MRILVVEDEPSIADFLKRGLEAEGYTVDCAADGDEGAEKALSRHVDLLILDVMLPRRDGLEVLRDVRERKPALPVIMLTARGEVEDKVEALDGGATDYVTKPFSFAELAARVRAHLREPSGHGATVLEACGIRADLISRDITHQGEPVKLSGREFELLVYFLRNPRVVLSREQILSAVWGYDFDPGTNVVEVYVGYLRRKLALPDRAAPIRTVRSVGYRLADE